MRHLPPWLAFAQLAALVVVCLCLVWVVPQADSVPPETAEAVSPLLVIENVGQYVPQARFLIWNGAAATWLAEDGLWIQQYQPARDAPAAGDAPPPGTSVWEPSSLEGVNLRLTFVGADPDAFPEPFLRLPINVSYLVGPATDWHAAVPVWGGAIVRDLYPGIDLLFDERGATEGLAPGWRLEAESGADLSAVRLRIEGADAVAVDEDGLRLRTAIGGLTLPRLHVTLDASQAAWPADEAIVADAAAAGGGAFEVPAGALLSSPESTLDLPASPPPPLFYSTFLGGSDWDVAYDIAVDETKAAYVAGRTPSGDFPTTPGAFDATGAGIDAFVAKLDATGTGLEYATFLGGASIDAGRALAISGGLVYLTGSTLSSDFPTTGDAYDPTCGSDGTCDAGGQGPYTDAFYATLNATGTDLVYATYLGGSDDDVGYGISLESGSAYLAGISYSSDFPASGYDANGDAFVVKMDGAGSPAYGTFLGGGDVDAGFAIATRSGEAYVTGETSSYDFPASGYLAGREAFVSRLDSSGGVVYSRLLAAWGDEMGYAIDVDASQQAYVAGLTTSTDFPITEGVYGGGSGDAFVAQLSDTGATLYAACLGGTGSDESRGISVDPWGGISVAGRTSSTDFPVTGDALQPALAGSSDAFVTRYELDSPLPQHITYASYLGGSSYDVAYGLAVDSVYNAYLAGSTASSDFPTSADGFDRTLGGTQDAFVSKLSVGVGPAIAIEKRTNGEDADEVPGPYILVGQPVDWSYVITNIGYMDLHDIGVVDDQGVPVDCPGTTLVVDESMTCTASGTTVADQYSNVGTVTASPPEGEAISTSDPSHYFGAVPGIALEKATNDQDADVAPGPYILAGDPVTWTYTVTNTGNAPLESIIVTDDQGVMVDCPQTSLVAGQSMTCTATGTAAAGQYDNLGEVTGTPPVGPDVSDSDPSHYYGATPLVDLEKHTNGQDGDTVPGVYLPVGSEVLWEYTVTNTGNVDLTGVTVSDNVLGTVCTIATLAPDATETCTLSGTADADQHANVGSVTGTPPVGPDVTDTDPSHYFGAQPSIDLEKYTQGQDADAAPGPLIRTGNSVAWTYTVTNTGNVTLTAVMVGDDNGTPADSGDDYVCTIGILAAGEVDSTTCQQSAVADIGQHANVGTATGTPPGGLADATDVDPSHYFGVAPSIDLEKYTNGQDADTAPGAYVLQGDPVLWEYQVTNTGNYTLTAVTVADSQGVIVSCPGDLLAPDESMTCSAGSAADEGQYANVGTASGTPPVGADVTHEDPSHYFGSTPSIDIEKWTNGQDADVAPGPYVLEGDPVQWTYTVTNTGNVTLTAVTVTDDVLGGTVCTIATLAPGAPAATCTANGTAGIGQYANVGSVSATPPGGLADVDDSDASHYFGATPSIDLEKRTNGQDADDVPGPYVLEGDPVQWTYTVTNTGNVTLTGVTVTDDNGTPADPEDDYVCTVGTLTAGAADATTCQQSATAGVGQYGNLGSVSGTPPVGPDVTDEDSSHYFGATPLLDIEKWTNGQDADVAPGPYVLEGDPVQWTYTVTNTGNVTLTGVTVGDDVLGTVCTIATLAPGAPAVICTVNGTAMVGQYANTGSVSGTPPGGLTDVVAEDPSHYYGATPSVDLEKRTNGQDADTAPGVYVPVGDPVQWTYTVTNTGNVTLSAVTVVDDNGTPADPADDYVCTVGTLAAGTVDDTTCWQSATAAEGRYANVGSVTATPPGGLPDLSDEDPSHYFGAIPSLDLEKATNDLDADTAPGPYILVSDPVTWTYVVTNTGNVTLTAVTVGDDVLGTVCSISTLTPGAPAVTCTVAGAADAGQYANTGTATGTPPGGLADASDSDPGHYYGTAPSVNLEKHVNGQDADEAPGAYVAVGDAVLWEYHVTNTGNVLLTGVVVEDDVLGEVCTLSSLAPATTETCTMNGTAAEGQHTNLGSVRGAPAVGPDVTDSDPGHYFGTVASLDVEKHTDGQDADAAPGVYLPAGDPVLWEYTVINTGNVALSGVTVSDDVEGPICSLGTLGVGVSRTCTWSGTVGEGQYANEGTVTGTPPGGLPDATASDPSHYFGVIATLDLEKHTNDQDADAAPGPYVPVGDPLLWEYAVTNTGNVLLTGVTVTDSVLGAVCTLPPLGAGETGTCAKSGTAVPGQYANEGTATGTPPGGLPDATDSDWSHYFGALTSVDLEKQTNGQDADAMPGIYIPVGDPVQWGYDVTNTGNVALTAVTISDDVLGTVCILDSLAPDATQTCTETGVAASGQYTNTGSVTGTPPGGLPAVSDTDSSHYFGSATAISLAKTTNGDDADNPTTGPDIRVGEAVTWEYTVTNEGNVALTNVTITDDVLGAVCTIPSLAAGSSEVCSKTGTAVEGQYANEGTASGTPPGGLPAVTTSDPSHYFGVLVTLDLEKHTNGQDGDLPPGPYILPGDPVTWTYVVTNTGNVALKSVTLVDDNGTPGDPVDDYDCFVGRLAAGVADSGCVQNGTAEEGAYHNVAAAQGTYGSWTATDSDASHYLGVVPGLDLEKYTDGQNADIAPGPYLLAGHPVTWTYVVTNVGDLEVVDVVVVDDNGTPEDPADDYSCTIDSIPVGGVDDTSCVQVGTAGFGQYENLASAEGLSGGFTVADLDPSHYYGAAPSVDLEKHTEGQDADSMPGPYIPAGDVVAWTYAVTNTGNVALSGVVVSDDNGTPEDPGDDYVCPIGALAVGEVDGTTCQQSAAAAAGQHANEGTVTGTPPGGLSEVTDTDPSHYFGVVATLDLAKRTNGRDADGAPGPYVLVDDSVTWTYAITNTGNVALTGVTLTDDNGTPADPADDYVCVAGTLAVGQADDSACGQSGTAAAGQYANVGTVNGTPPGGLPDAVASDPSHYYGTLPSIDLEKHTNGQDADGTPGVYVSVDDAVLWEYHVTNTGNVALTDVVVQDDVLGTVCTLDSLAPAATQTCTASDTAAEGQYGNEGSVHGTPPVGPDVTDSDPSHYFGVAASLALEKQTNGQDADSIPGVYIPVGQVVLWEYTVTNTSNVALSRVTITDDVLGAVCTLSSLAPGAAQTCTRSGTAAEGQYTNTGSVTGSPPGGLPDVSDTDPSHYFGTLTGLSLTKTTNGEEADSPPGPDIRVGEAVTWAYTVTNESNVELAGVTVVDDNGTPAEPSDDYVCAVGALAVGAVDGTTCWQSAAAGEGQYVNQGTATGTPPGGLPAMTTSDLSHYFGVLVTLDLEKHTNGQDADLAPGPYILPGDPVTWTYVVTNTGNVALSGVTVVDDNGTPGDPGDDYTCPVGALAVGAADSSCVQNGTAEWGAYANLAAAQGAYGPWTASDSDPSHYLGVVPGLDLEKHTVGQDADAAPGPYLMAGDPVTWTYVVTNVGDLEVVDVVVVDDNGTPGDPADDYGCTIDSIPVGGVDGTTCVQVGTAGAGQYENLASAEGLSGGFPVVDLDPSHYYGAVPSIDLEKHTEGQDADGAPGPYVPVGDEVLWTYTVTNTGNVELTGVTVVDDNGTPGDPADDYVCTIGTMAAGAVDSTSCGYSALAAAGQYENVGTVTGAPPDGLSDVTDSDPSHYYGAAPSIDLEKHTNGQDADDVPGVYVLTGDAVAWTYAITNTGNVTLTAVTVSDDNGTPADPADDYVCAVGTLAAGAVDRTTCQQGATAVEGQYASEGTVSGTPPGGLLDAVDADPSHYFGTSPAIDLEKHTLWQDADLTPGPYILVGEPVTWTYAVTNTGNVTLTGVSVTDDRGVEVLCPQQTLAPGEGMACEADGSALPDQYANVGTVVSSAPTGPAVTADDVSHYFGVLPELTLQKLTNGQDADTLPGPFIGVGEPVTWTYQVTNTGNITLTEVLVADDQGLEVTCPGTELVPGQGMNCEASGTAAAGQYANLGTATAAPVGGFEAISAEDPSHYYGGRLSIDLAKRTNGFDADLPPGPEIRAEEPVLWTYVVTNTGTVTLTDVVVWDDQGVSVSCPQTSLDPGESMACSGAGLAVVGQYENVGTVEGRFGPVTTSDLDVSHYLGLPSRYLRYLPVVMR